MITTETFYILTGVLAISVILVHAIASTDWK